MWETLEVIKNTALLCSTSTGGTSKFWEHSTELNILRGRKCTQHIRAQGYIQSCSEPLTENFTFFLQETFTNSMNQALKEWK